MPTSCALALLALALAAALAAASPDAPARAPDGDALVLDVMTFNIRYGTAQDLENRWENRRDLVVDILRGEGGTPERPGWDAVGIQEALRFQLDEIREALPGYAEVGVGRDDGATEGEYSPILYRTDRFELAGSGTFWLSDTPETPGSTSWGNTIPRICTWARLVDRRSGRGFTVYNAHLDHASAPSRARSACLIAERVAGREHPEEPVILMGDFNATESEGVVRFLTGELDRPSSACPEGGAAPPRLVDSYRSVHPDDEDAGTFNGFRPQAVAGLRIDYILCDARARVLEASIDRRAPDGRLPSDHFPVTARLRWDDPEPRAE